ncbi:MAG: Zn-ribbon domain-containing OB-fold protein [Candidatus Lokiarchaeota archaeon]|nr:Zn-ribbon domain-containing OB-fold protein [Candidatus Lokiarchaeota archaeon]
MSEVKKPFTIESYLENIQNKKLTGTKCKDCGEMYVPIRKLCKKCSSTNMEWIEMSGEGKLAAFTSITVGTPLFVERGYGRNKPYCFSVVTLKEGPMISGQLVGVDESKPETIKIGMSVKATFLESESNGKTRVDLGFEPI